MREGKIMFLPLLMAGFMILAAGTAVAQWGADTRVETDTGSNYSSYVVTTASGTKVNVIWRDHRPPGTYDNGSIYANYSHDNGATWGTADQRIDLGKVEGSSLSTRPAVASSGDYVYATWQDHRNDPATSPPFENPNLFFNRSIDGGLTWEASDQRIDTGASANSTLARNISIRAYDSNVYVCWQDERSGTPNVYFSMSPSYGAAGSWTTPILVDAAGGAYYTQKYPVMDCSGERVYVAWQDSRNAYQDIYFNHSADGGVTWNSSDVRRVDTDIPATGDSIYIEMAAAKEGGGGGGGGGFPYAGPIPPFLMQYNRVGRFGTSAGSSSLSGDRMPVYCIWRDYRSAQGSFQLDIYANSSTDGGLTWGAQDKRLNSHHAAPGSIWVGEPAIAAAGEAVYGIWLDGKDDPTPGSSPYIDDVYMNKSLSYGSGGSWSGCIRMDEGVSPGAADSWNPKVAAYAGHVWVVWMDERDDPVYSDDSVYCTYSSDKGNTWTFSERVDSGGSDPDAGYCEICNFGRTLHVSWSDYRLGASDAFYNGRTF